MLFCPGTVINNSPLFSNVPWLHKSQMDCIITLHLEQLIPVLYKLFQNTVEM
jgi:hypothetical protein